MSGLSLLAWRQARHARGRTLLLVTAVAVALFVPLASGTLTARFDRALRARAASTPLVVGAAGSRFDLTLEALFFRGAERPGITKAFADELRADGRALVVPLHLEHTVQQRPFVGTSVEYYEQRGLVAARGALPQFVGDLALGARAAAELGLEVVEPRGIREDAVPDLEPELGCRARRARGPRRTGAGLLAPRRVLAARSTRCWSPRTAAAGPCARGAGGPRARGRPRGARRRRRS